jgi:hypothetical protein
MVTNSIVFGFQWRKPLGLARRGNDAVRAQAARRFRRDFAFGVGCVAAMSVIACSGNNDGQSTTSGGSGQGGNSASSHTGQIVGGSTTSGSGSSSRGGSGGAPVGTVTAPVELTDSGLVFSVPRGLYTEPFELTISHATATSVTYTLDASDPRSSATSLKGALPLKLKIDPADTTHRFTSPTVIVRATVGGADAAPATVVTHSYLFVHRVVELSPDGVVPGSSWPAPSTSSVGQIMDYGMDPDVTEASEYASSMDLALTAIPSLSLVTDLSNLFDSTNGIYVNASEEGSAWERFASIELLNPDNRPGFQANTGVRIRGGFSRDNSVPKHAFRLFFRGDYGTKKLEYPLFDSEGASSFDKVDLRTTQNYSWSNDGGADYNANIMNRDVFSRDLQREMGRPYTRSRYYHLYLDGVYWGLYQTQERAESRYAQTYFGGKSDDYDVVKVERGADGGAAGTNVIAATDGTLDTWQAVWTACQTGFATDAAYYALEGKDATGKRDATRPVLVDIDNLIDYMMVIFYTANFDSPCSKWFDNADPNNFFMIKSRVNNDAGFVFFAHDNEHSLMPDPITITSGVDENRVNIGELKDNYRMTVTDFSRFHPQWLHYRLTSNALYRARFAARARTLLGTDGLLTEAKTTALFDARAKEIELAIIAESARWGDAQRPNQPRTKNDDWVPAIQRTREGFFAKRTAIVIEQLTAAGLY